MLEKAIEAKLSEYQDPCLGKDFITAKAVKNIQINEHAVIIQLTLGYPNLSDQERLKLDLEKHLASVLNGKSLALQITTQIEPHAGRQGIPALKNVKNIIAVASGKGGVGKSTVAVNLALALAKEGAQVGLLDADIYGPSQPAMLNALGEKPVVEGKSLQPIKRHGIQSMSIGYLIDATAPMVWRGPMIGKALQQLLQDTEWQDLDYLIIDLPPGTGDIQLTLCQKIPVSGAVMVTTPQDLALHDVRRACEMFNKLNVPILGVIENMSVYHCDNCGHEQALFGTGGGELLAKEYGVNLLQKIPLDIKIRTMTDSGHPPVVQNPKSHQANAFFNAARKAAARLSLESKDYSKRFPKIVVQHDKKEE